MNEGEFLKEFGGKVLVGTLLMWLAVFAFQQLGSNGRAAFLADQAVNPRPNCGNGHFTILPHTNAPSWVGDYLGMTDPQTAQGHFCAGDSSLVSWFDAYGPFNYEELIIHPAPGNSVTVTNSGATTVIIGTPPSNPNNPLTLAVNDEAKIVCWTETEDAIRINFIGIADRVVQGILPLSTLDEASAARRSNLPRYNGIAATVQCRQAHVELPPGNSVTIQQSTESQLPK